MGKKSDEKLSKLTQLFEEIFNVIFDDKEIWMSDVHFKDTPYRLAKMYLDEIFRGVTKKKKSSENSHANHDFDFKLFEISNESTSKVIIENLTVKAFCAHHLAPFLGKCTVEYIPSKHILGLSKFQRILDTLCGIPTVQEELTKKYAQVLYDILKPRYLKVTMNCIHTCMISRGVKLENANTITEYVIGKEDEGVSIHGKTVLCA